VPRDLFGSHLRPDVESFLLGAPPFFVLLPTLLLRFSTLSFRLEFRICVARQADPQSAEADAVITACRVVADSAYSDGERAALAQWPRTAPISCLHDVMMPYSARDCLDGENWYLSDDLRVRAEAEDRPSSYQDLTLPCGGTLDPVR
jgi:hypothetical protein